MKRFKLWQLPRLNISSKLKAMERINNLEKALIETQALCNQQSLIIRRLVGEVGIEAIRTKRPKLTIMEEMISGDAVVFSDSAILDDFTACTGCGMSPTDCECDELDL